VVLVQSLIAVPPAVADGSCVEPSQFGRAGIEPAQFGRAQFGRAGIEASGVSWRHDEVIEGERLFAVRPVRDQLCGVARV
jgi:hypothetical protein